MYKICEKCKEKYDLKEKTCLKCGRKLKKQHTEEELKELVDSAKNLGIRVILDGVFNHTGDNSVYFNKYGKYPSVGAYQSKESPYYSWYSFQEFPNK